MQIINFNDKKLVDIATETLKNGGILIYPTETCYGVGVDATNPEAVTKVLKYKKRPAGKPISIGVADESMAKKYVNINSEAKKIYDNFLPGPVTVISKSLGKIDKRLESETGTIGIRMSSNAILANIIQEFGKPVTTTSANSSGKKTPYSVNDILENLTEKQKNMIDVIIDAGVLPNNPPSTVVDTTSNDLKIYRKGNLNPNEKQINEVIDSPEAMLQFGEKMINKHLKNLDEKPIIFLLNGDLGAGKTYFTKGVAKALRIKETVKSPTYGYVAEYDFNYSGNSGKLYHIDAWKIQSIEDLEIMNFEEFFEIKNVVVIEWPSVIENLGSDILSKFEPVSLDFEVTGAETRRVTIAAQ